MKKRISRKCFQNERETRRWFRTRRAKDDEEWCETHLFNVRFMVYICYGSLVNGSASVEIYDVRRLATNFRQQGEQGAVEISLRFYFFGG